MKSIDFSFLGDAFVLRDAQEACFANVARHANRQFNAYLKLWGAGRGRLAPLNGWMR
jgi:hypothetical protein